jgi:F0F1-type ATP synthase delta subunit
MPKKYAKALFDLIQDKNKDEADKTVADFLRYMEAKNKTKLLPKIVLEIERLYKKASKSAPKIYLVKEEDSDKAIKKAESLGAYNPQIEKDASLIGGFKIKTKNFVFDASYKKYLLELYESLRK